MISNVALRTKEDLKMLLETQNPGVIIVKFGATWCKPCQTIEPFVQSRFTRLPQDKITVVKVDIDDSMDLYGFFKTKRLIQGVPTMFAYFKGNVAVVPDEMVSGTAEKAIVEFFTQCVDHVS